MQTTVSVHISGRSFFMDEDAHQRLSAYLKKLQLRYGNVEGGSEIVADIESRIAELISQKINSSTSVVTLTLVEEIISIMGEPDEFEQTNTNTKDQTSSPQAPWIRPAKRLYRDTDNRLLGGVCAGISAYLGIDVALVRIIAVIILIATSFTAAFVYVVMWAVIPEAITPSQKLEMRGENINIENIEKAVREEFEEVKKGFSKMQQSHTYQQSKNYMEKLNQRDKTVLIVVGVLFLAFLIFNVLKVVHWPIFHFTLNNFNWPFWEHLPFPVFIPIAIILVGIVLLLTKHSQKVWIWIVAVFLFLMLIFPFAVFVVRQIFNGIHF
ncbi:MAG: PspC domain-containing protein [Breznakibacter sp.]